MTDRSVAVVPGGTGSIGRHLIPLLLERGFNVACTYLVPEEAAAFEEELDLEEDRLILRRVDCTDAEAVNDFVDEAVGAFGPINVMASLVGGWAGGRDVAETSDVRLDRMLDLNLRTAWNASRAAIPHMSQDWGRIILMGSKHAIDCPAGQAAYNIAKAGILTLARSIAIELLDTSTTSNALLPSVINTDATRAALPFADYVNWPQPSEVADVISFLSSPESKAVNGSAVPVWGSAAI